jgi:hypothetical protein
MDAIDEYRLRQAFERLDRAIAANDQVAAMLARDEINRILARNDPTRIKLSTSTGTGGLPLGGLPPWAREIIENRGFRLRALEKALNVDKAVISPGMVEGAPGIKLELKF